MIQNVKTLAVFMAIVAVLVGGYYLFFSTDPLPEYTYSAENHGIPVFSNEKAIIDHFNDLATQPDFVIIPSMNEQGELNYFSSQGMTMLQVVIEANQKSTVSMVKVYDNSFNHIYCQTNYGSQTVNEKISVESCASYIENSPAEKIFIELPNSRLKKPYVVLKGNTITLYPRVKEDIPGVSFLVANALYQNAPTIIGQFNYVADNVANSSGGN